MWIHFFSNFPTFCPDKNKFFTTKTKCINVCINEALLQVTIDKNGDLSIFYQVGGSEDKFIETIYIHAWKKLFRYTKLMVIWIVACMGQWIKYAYWGLEGLFLELIAIIEQSYNMCRNYDAVFVDGRGGPHPWCWTQRCVALWGIVNVGRESRWYRPNSGYHEPNAPFLFPS